MSAPNSIWPLPTAVILPFPLTVGATFTPPVPGVVIAGVGSGSGFGFDAEPAGVTGEALNAFGCAIARSTPREHVIFAVVPSVKPRSVALGEAAVILHVRLFVPCTVIVFTFSTLILPVTEVPFAAGAALTEAAVASASARIDAIAARRTCRRYHP